MEKRTILHCDANCFYASVECALHPELRGKCIAVCGDPTKRHGIVLTKSQEAKMCGVATGDTISDAKAKCPQLIIIQTHFEDYLDFSNKLFNIYTQYTDRVEPFGLDECWLDVTHSKLLGNGKEIADSIRTRVKHNLGITISVGVSFNKVFAKLGSDLKKPDATTVLDESNFRSLIYNNPVSDLLMVGRKTVPVLRKLNIKTIGDLAKSNVDLLKDHLGINGIKLYEWANGIDNEPVALYYDSHSPKNISNSVTTYRDLVSTAEVLNVARSLCELVSTRLLHYNFATSCVSICLKFNDFSWYSKQTQIQPTNNAVSIFNKISQLIKEVKSNTPVRMVAVGTSNLSVDTYIQLDLFDPTAEKRRQLDVSLTKIKNKYGYKSIQPASTLIDTELSATIDDSDI